MLLNDFVITQNNTSQTHYQLELDEAINWQTISSSIKMNVYRIIQEAAQNIHKFAEAKNAVISLLLDDNILCLSISDDGKGFELDAKKTGIGLKNIKQRVTLLQEKCAIHSIPNKNTAINIAIPLV
jgi:signal transduction histidine kinase